MLILKADNCPLSKLNLSYPISAADLVSYEHGNEKLRGKVNSFFRDGTIPSTCEEKKEENERKDKEQNLMI